MIIHNETNDILGILQYYNETYITQYIIDDYARIN